MSGAREGRTELKATGGRVGHRLSIAARYFLRNEAKKSFVSTQFQSGAAQLHATANPLLGFDRVIVWIAIWRNLLPEKHRAIPRLEITRQRRFVVDTAAGLEPR